MVDMKTEESAADEKRYDDDDDFELLCGECLEVVMSQSHSVGGKRIFVVHRSLCSAVEALQ